MDGILIVDKPLGPTSHDICQQAKRLFKAKKVGHAGTLDPLATGVLILLFGKATKLSNRFLGAKKEYIFEMELGRTSDTYDAQGTLTPKIAVPDNVEEKLKKLLPKFTGKIEQTVPSYSAVKFKGTPLYRLARQGKEVPKKTREICIEQLTIEKLEFPRGTLKVLCSSGTYVRSLAHDLGQQLSCGAYVTALRRTRSEPFLISQAVSWDSSKEELFRNFIVSPSIPDIESKG